MKSGLSYSAYKASGMSWLGDVPAHWNILRLRNIAKLLVSNVDKHSQEGEKAVRLCNYVDVYKNERITENIVFMRATASDEEIERFRLERGDVLITKDSESWTDIGVPALVEFCEPNLLCGYHLALLRPVKELINSSYLLRALQSSVVAQQFHVQANGVTRYGLSYAAIKSIRMPIPPLNEQDNIVQYVDHVDQIIRRFIHNRRQLIKLLNEHKQAIITQAVTRGLNPNVPLRPSRIDWIGDIPEHWEAWQIGHIAKVGNGSTPSRSNLRYWSDGYYPWLNSSSVNAGTIVCASRYVTALALEECHLPRVKKGSVLVAITGQGKTRGTSAVLAIDEATINQHIAYLTPRDKESRVTGDYLQSFLSSAYPELRRISDDSGSTKGALTCGDLRHFKVVLPPREEQDMIVSMIQRDTLNLEIAIQNVKQEISLVLEYRTRLITDVVTGKLDVRQAALQLEDLGAEEIDKLSLDEELDPDAMIEDDEELENTEEVAYVDD